MTLASQEVIPEEPILIEENDDPSDLVILKSAEDILRILKMAAGNPNSLNLAFDSSFITESLELLVTSLSDLSSLEALSLECYNLDEISDDAISLFCLLIKNQTSLKSLKMDLTKCQRITNKGINQIADTLNYNLRELSLTLNHCTIGPLDQLFGAIAHLKQLKSLQKNILKAI